MPNTVSTPAASRTSTIASPTRRVFTLASHHPPIPACAALVTAQIVDNLARTPGCRPATLSPMRTLIADVRLIDGVADTAREHVDVLIDGDGKTLLPGLIDAHAHYTFDPTEGSIGVILRRSDADIVLAAAGHAAVALRAG